LKLDTNGDFIWAEVTGNSDSQSAMNLAIDASNALYMHNSFSGLIDADPSANELNISSVSATDFLISKWGTCAQTSSNLTESACESYNLNGQTFTSSGIYIQAIPNYVGCDSLITLNLTISNNTYNTINPTECSTYLSPSGHIYNASGTYADTISNSIGCDSIITINLTINSSSSKITPTECFSYTSPSGNFTWNVGGSYLDTIPNVIGCDSLITINLTINTANSSVSQSGISLTADETGATYKWLDCPGMTEIAGATNQTFTAIANGDYAVIVTQNGCSDTSACFTVTGVGVIENSFGNDLLLYPNPTMGNFSIDLGEKYNSISVTITDLAGKLIHVKKYSESQIIDLNVDEPTGIYLLRIETEYKNALIRLIKK